MQLPLQPEQRVDDLPGLLPARRQQRSRRLSSKDQQLPCTMPSSSSTSKRSSDMARRWLAATTATTAAAALLLTSTASSVAAQALGNQQLPFQLQNSSGWSDVGPEASGSKLYGRFLHVTDMHPDSFYQYNSAVSSGCHSSKPKKKKPDGKRRAGYWGSGTSECDSPKHLISSTLDWLARNWLIGEEDGFDFILWTGDSARHDIDSDHPRSREEIFEYNRWALEQLEMRFPRTPIVPSIGNNDIFPHNIMFPGPNEVTRTFGSIWLNHVPESEFHVFQRGGYFAKEIIPNALAVLSLNTLYFYDSNKAVDGCKRYKRKTPEKDRDPGSVQLDWLEVQIAQYRSRGMQVQLIGHVPPTAGNFFPRCYDRYTDIVLRYQDTIVGQHFGHMNLDAIFVQEGPGGTTKDAENGLQLQEEEEREEALAHSAEQVHTTDNKDIVQDILDEFDTLPGKRRTNLDRYNFYFAAPSVVPTWWPSVRVWTYNTTRSSAFKPSSLQEEIEGGEEEEADEEEEEEGDEIRASRSHRRRKPGKRRKHQKPKPYHSDPLSPSRSNRFLTPLGYSQWVLDIDRANKEYAKRKDGKKKGKRGAGHHKKGRWAHHQAKEGNHEKSPPELKYQLEYATYTQSTLWAGLTPSDEKKNSNSSKHVDHRKHVPVPIHLLQAELKRLGVDPRLLIASQQTAKTKKLPKKVRHLTDWSLESMTIPNVMSLARRLANDAKLWKRYVHRVFSSSGAERK